MVRQWDCYVEKFAMGELLYFRDSFQEKSQTNQLAVIAIYRRLNDDVVTIDGLNVSWINLETFSR